MNTMVFDIETIPDTDSGRKIYELGADISEHDVERTMQHLRCQKTGSEFQPPHLHRVVAISVALKKSDNSLSVCSMGNSESSEKDIIETFFKGVDHYQPQLISWNGSGFDLPVLHFRALLHGIPSGRYWERGDNDTAFRYNNYLARYHWRHLDLMDVLAAFNARMYAPLNEVAKILGFPGKLGMDGSQVSDAFRAGKIEAIRNYCEIDVLNTYLIFLRFELIQNKIMPAEYESLCQDLRKFLEQGKATHFSEFLSAWEVSQ